MMRLLIAVVLAWPLVLSAGFYDGNDLMEYCDKPNANFSHFSSCVSYLAGIEDAEEMFVGWNHKQPYFCVPDRTSLNQLRLVFLRWMKQRPAKWQHDASSLVATAYREEWPCPPTKEEKAANMYFQSCYAFLGYYHGKIDGIWGPQSKAAEATAIKVYPNLDGAKEACLDQGWTPPE